VGAEAIGSASGDADSGGAVLSEVFGLDGFDVLAAADAAGELEIMIETPAAALCARELAQHVDFFSIGTNDLTQYTMAADRTNARLEKLCRADHPAVLRMIELACKGARDAGIWVGVCGEAAGDPALIPQLLSWGVTELSMSPSLIARAKKTVIETGSGSAAAWTATNPPRAGSKAALGRRARP